MKKSGQQDFWSATVHSGPGEVRYSMPDMLRELEADRASTSFAMEKLDQESITKLFEPNRTRRGRSKAARRE